MKTIIILIALSLTSSLFANVKCEAKAKEAAVAMAKVAFPKYAKTIKFGAVTGGERKKDYVELWIEVKLIGAVTTEYKVNATVGADSICYPYSVEWTTGN